jgi:hypothetical protein
VGRREEWVAGAGLAGKVVGRAEELVKRGAPEVPAGRAAAVVLVSGKVSVEVAASRRGDSPGAVLGLGA